MDPHEAGKQGGHTSGSGADSSTTSSGGSGSGRRFPCPLMLHIADNVTEFAHGKVDPHEAGKMGGSK